MTVLASVTRILSWASSQIMARRSRRRVSISAPPDRLLVISTPRRDHELQVDEIIRRMHLRKCGGWKEVPFPVPRISWEMPSTSKGGSK